MRQRTDWSIERKSAMAENFLKLRSGFTADARPDALRRVCRLDKGWKQPDASPQRCVVVTSVAVSNFAAAILGNKSGVMVTASLVCWGIEDWFAEPLGF
jgi:hypothetical protein